MKLIFFLIATLILSATCSDYWARREEFIKREESRAVGGSLVLNEKENLANRILMDFKLRELEKGAKNFSDYLPARHFFDARKTIEKSEVFKIIQMLPKGGSLHGHDTCLTSGEYLYNLTYKENLYACTNNGLKLHFFENPNKLCNWTLVAKLRNETFNEWLRSQLTLLVQNPRQRYPNTNVAWKNFQSLFGIVGGMLLYRPVFKEYFYQALEELYQDNVMYLELRGLLPPVYELNGTQYSPLEVLQIYKETADEFKLAHPGFHGVRFIYAPMRSVPSETIENYIKIAKSLKKKYPDFVVGFDLVGQEDLGQPLTSFVPQIQQLAADFKFFFHAGETNWYGQNVDFNLVDAVLLGTTRIGHGLALLKHPEVLETVRASGIAIEVCPISNQVLKFVDDFRNHPGSVLLAGGYPVVIANDGPSFWGAKGLSYDWYIAFMGLASKKADLKLLKQLAINSVKYSALKLTEQEEFMGRWNKEWDQFVEKIILFYAKNQSHVVLTKHSINKGKN